MAKRKRSAGVSKDSPGPRTPGGREDRFTPVRRSKRTEGRQFDRSKYEKRKKLPAQGGEVSETERRQRAKEQTRMAQNRRIARQGAAQRRATRDRQEAAELRAADNWWRAKEQTRMAQNRHIARKGAAQRRAQSQGGEVSETERRRRAVATPPSWTPEEQANAARYMDNRTANYSPQGPRRVAEAGSRGNWIQRLAQLAGGKLAEQVRQYTSGGTLGGAVGGTLGGAVGRTAGQGGTLGGTAAAGLLGGAVGRTAGQFGDYQGAMPPPGGAVNQYYYPTPSPTQTQGEWQQGDPSQYRGLPDPGVQIQTPYPGQPGNFMVEQNPQYGGLPPPSVQFATGHQYNAEQERAARMKLYAERMARERANAIWQGWQPHLGQW